MDSRTFSAVTVFNIDNAGKLVEKYPADCKSQVTCSYDPSGLSIRILPGELFCAKLGLPTYHKHVELSRQIPL